MCDTESEAALAASHRNSRRFATWPSSRSLAGQGRLGRSQEIASWPGDALAAPGQPGSGHGVYRRAGSSPAPATKPAATGRGAGAGENVGSHVRAAIRPSERAPSTPLSRTYKSPLPGDIRGPGESERIGTNSGGTDAIKVRRSAYPEAWNSVCDLLYSLYSYALRSALQMVAAVFPPARGRAWALEGAGVSCSRKSTVQY